LRIGYLVVLLVAAGFVADATMCTTMGGEMSQAEHYSLADMKGEWSGTVDQFSHDIRGKFSVRMTVESISGDEFTGTMDWPESENTKTEIKGMFDGKVIKWMETAYLKGNDVYLYGLYVAKFSTRSEIAGEWMDPKYPTYFNGPKYGVPGATIVLKKKSGSATLR
jgi:hypothetical protein